MNPKLIVLFIAPTLLGWLFLKQCLSQSNLPLKKLFSLVFAPVMGLAVISLAVFIITAAVPEQARLLAVLTPWVLSIVFLSLLVSKHQQTDLKTNPQKSLFSLLVVSGPLTFGQITRIAVNGLLVIALILTFVNFTHHLMSYMTWNAFGGWDARYFWHLKARMYVRDPEQWRLLFSEYFRWGNNDYPLMVPGIIAWGWHFLGREALIWPAIVSYLFTYSLGALIIWHLSLWRSWSSAAVAGIFFFTLPVYLFWGGTMYCDIPYAFFSNGSLLLLLSALRLNDRRLLTLSAFFAGCSAFTKNEGLLFIIWYLIITVPVLLHEHRHSRADLLRSFTAVIQGLFIPACLCLYFKIALTGGQNNLVSKRNPADILQALTDWPRNRVILEGFRVYMADAGNWNGLWLLLGAAALYWPLSKKQAPLPYSWILLLAVLLINLGYALIFTITPHNIYKHITTALLRLLLQTGVLALVFIVETFGFSKKSEPTLSAHS